MCSWLIKKQLTSEPFLTKKAFIRLASRTTATRRERKHVFGELWPVQRWVTESAVFLHVLPQFDPKSCKHHIWLLLVLVEVLCYVLSNVNIFFLFILHKLCFVFLVPAYVTVMTSAFLLQCI